MKSKKTAGCEKEEAEPSSTPKKGEYHVKTIPVEKEKGQTLLEATCMDDPHVASKQCTRSWETSGICKKVEDLCFRINDGVLT